MFFFLPNDSAPPGGCFVRQGEQSSVCLSRRDYIIEVWRCPEDSRYLEMYTKSQDENSKEANPPLFLAGQDFSLLFFPAHGPVCALVLFVAPVLWQSSPSAHRGDMLGLHTQSRTGD